MDIDIVHAVVTGLVVFAAVFAVQRSGYLGRMSRAMRILAVVAVVVVVMLLLDFIWPALSSVPAAG